MTKYGDVNQRTAAWAATEMLTHAEPMVVLSRYGMSKPVPKNKADNVKFRRPKPFAISTVPVAEGVTPSAQVMQYEDVQATLLQYGMPTMITDKVEDLAEDPVLADASMLCGEQAGETLEMVTYGVVKAGTSVFYGNGSARTDVNTAITTAKQRAVTRLLKANRAKKITKKIAAGPNIGTEPVDAAYFAFCHTDCESDIRDMTGFVPVEKYGQMKAEPFEIGKVEDVRYIAAPHFEPWEDGGGDKGTMKSKTGVKADVYPVLYIAKECFGVVPLKGASAITPMVINPNTPSKSDPMGQRGYVSWKAYYASVILNQAWMARLEIAVKAL